jgi:hypothetical protein
MVTNAVDTLLPEETVVYFQTTPHSFTRFLVLVFSFW